MDGKLKDLAMLNGYKNMKELAQQCQMPYSTILHYNRAAINTWKHENIEKIANALGYSVHKLLVLINEPIYRPFIKWVGGKRQLLPELINYAPKQYNRYLEAFVGGGALVFKLAPQDAIINDSNEELINAWKVLRDNFKELSTKLFYHQEHDSKDHYLQVRGVDRNGKIRKMSKIQRAARFIYLNKAGFNGLWRVNQKGQNNVPFGGHKHLNLIPKFLEDDSEYLKKNNITIKNQDYNAIMSDAKPGDFIYLDPPYIPVTMTASFTSYTKYGFGLIQQEELAKKATKLAQSGVKVMLSNSDVDLIPKLYSEDIFTIHHVQASRAINSNAKKRGKVGEVIITSNNY